MGKVLLLIVLFFAFGAASILNAQDNKLVVLKLKNGYSVKGEIIEKSDSKIKIRTLDGQIFEYRSDEIDTTAIEAKSSSFNKDIPLVVSKGDMIINVGIGLLGNKVYDKLTIPQIPVSFEYIILDNLFEGKGALGGGGYFGYSASKVNYTYGRTDKSLKYIIGARGYIHYALIDKLDTYGGVLLGYKSDVTIVDNSEYPEYNSKSTDGAPVVTLFAGCRYFFTDNIAGMAELGWGMSVITLGVAVKL